MCAYGYVHTVPVLAEARGMRFSGAEVTGVFELPNEDAEYLTPVPCKSSMCALNYPVISPVPPSPPFFFF